MIEFDTANRCGSCGHYRPLDGYGRAGRCTAMTIKRPQPWCCYNVTFDGTQHPLVFADQKKCNLHTDRRRQL